MRKKVPLGVVIALMLITAAITVSLTVTYYTKEYNALIGDLPQRAQQYALLEEVDAVVRANYYGDLTAAALDQSVADGYMKGLDDPHSVYLSAEDYAVYADMDSGKMQGTGITAVFDVSAEALTVTAVAEHSPAAAQNVQIGDMIVAVDGEAVTRENGQAMLRGVSSGRSGVVTLSLRRQTKDLPDVELARGYTTPSCFYELRNQLGYIRIVRFADDTPALFSEAITEFENEDAQGLIIDVRNNDSNDIAAAAEIIDRIVPLATEGVGAIAIEKNAAGETVNLYAADAESVQLPVIVLLNSRTGGAAELLACDLRDFSKARLVGEPSMGHGTVQRVFTLRDGGALVLTVAEIVPYLGESFNGAGVTPDDVIPMSAADKDRLFASSDVSDDQYNAAVATLLGQ